MELLPSKFCVFGSHGWLNYALAFLAITGGRVAFVMAVEYYTNSATLTYQYRIGTRTRSKYIEKGAYKYNIHMRGVRGEILMMMGSHC